MFPVQLTTTGFTTFRTTGPVPADAWRRTLSVRSLLPDKLETGLMAIDGVDKRRRGKRKEGEERRGEEPVRNGSTSDPACVCMERERADAGRDG